MLYFRDTHREKAPSNKTSTLTKSINMDIWVLGTSIQLFISGSYTEKGKTPFIVIGPFCTPHSVCLKIGFWQGSFLWKCCLFNLSTFNWKTILQFFEKDFRLSACFIVKLLKKHFYENENFQGWSQKTFRSLKRRAILKMHSTLF